MRGKECTIEPNDRDLLDTISTEPDNASEIDAFFTTIQRLHRDFPTKQHAQTKGFDEVVRQGDHLYTQHPKNSTLYSRTCSATPYFPLARTIYTQSLPQSLPQSLLKLASLSGTQGTLARNSDNAARAIEHFGMEIAFYEEAVKNNMTEPHDIRLAGAYEHMALGTQQLGAYDEAFEWHEKNIETLTKYHKDEVIDIAIAHVNRSWALWKTNKPDEAEKVLEGVLDTVRAALEGNSHNFQARRARAFALRVLGNVYLAQGRFDDAFDAHERAYDEQVRTWGATHFEAGLLTYRMRCHYERRDDVDEAM
ncbi:hypothetical protein CC86DRAFT_379468 [Ophiobolus disseminans]|uniref:Uncharacterized protein n=1 Tax=Ophiobolus disseminans TaxID=1469910 RepID=A0A6A7AB93_9PLEO|nr:hypothetical protein CC86DRAFT_379468 [Ophiobolus disseminans]